jgi:hypothetical protein
MGENTAAAVADVRAALTEAEIAATNDVELGRFVAQQGGDVAAATAAFQAYRKWRSDNAVDKVLDGIVPKADVIDRLIPYAYYKFDLDGHPIYWEKTGQINASLLSTHCTTDELVVAHVAGVERLAAKMVASSEATGKTVDQFTTVLDLNGLSVAHLNAVPFLRACAELDQKYFPGRIAKVIIINGPWIMPMAFEACKIFLDEATIKSVQVLASVDELKKHIAVDSIPVEYGGTCADLIPVDDCADLSNGPVSEIEKHAHLGLTKKNVAAADQFLESHTCGDDGGVFTWFFESEGGYDIEFTVFNQETNEVISAPRRVCSGKGCYQASGKTSLVFKWNNEYSYFTSKDLQYHVSVAANVDIKIGTVQVTESLDEKAAADAK